MCQDFGHVFRMRLISRIWTDSSILLSAISWFLLKISTTKDWTYIYLCKAKLLVDLTHAPPAPFLYFIVCHSTDVRLQHPHGGQTTRFSPSPWWWGGGGGILTSTGFSEIAVFCTSFHRSISHPSRKFYPKVISGQVRSSDPTQKYLWLRCDYSL